METLFLQPFLSICSKGYSHTAMIYNCPIEVCYFQLINNHTFSYSFIDYNGTAVLVAQNYKEHALTQHK